MTSTQGHFEIGLPVEARRILSQCIGRLCEITIIRPLDGLKYLFSTSLLGYV